MYSSTISLADPPAESSIADGVTWVQGVALGSTATAVAVIAVAAIGLLMLSGRLELRRGITVVLGCFVLFGAAGIAGTLTSLARTGAQPLRMADPDSTHLLSSQLQSPPPLAAYDPYAGASVPENRQR